jgi:hypothetical protein
MVSNISDFDLMSPFETSHTNGIIEEQLKALFIDLFNELFTEQIKDIHDYGMPMFGGSKVIERFTKQDGLTALRRPNSSDLIMRVIYTNWKSLASKRGLKFLEFVLQMIWTDQWELHRLWHDWNRREEYPTLSTMDKTEGSFLTSRIMVLMNDNVDKQELSELAPSISRLVPANIVPIIAMRLPVNDINLSLGIIAVPYMVASFQYGIE